MNKISIEEIQGKKYTVVWHEEDLHGYRVKAITVGYVLFCCNRTAHLATALPALPRNPKPEHAALLYRYMAEGFEIGFDKNFHSGVPKTIIEMCSKEGSEITHATHNGNRVEIAITDEAHNG